MGRKRPITRLLPNREQSTRVGLPSRSPMHPIDPLNTKTQEGTQMPTIAQKKAMIEQEKLDKSARRIAYATMGTMLTLSTAANVLTAWDHDVVSKVVAGVPPISLFITSLLYERMRSTKLIKVGMLLTILVSLAFSWVHIAELAYTHHQHLVISLLLPVIIDVPMLFAGTIIINQRNNAPTLVKTVESVEPVAKAPVKATPTKKAPVRKTTPKHTTPEYSPERHVSLVNA